MIKVSQIDKKKGLLSADDASENPDKTMRDAFDRFSLNVKK